MKRLNFRYAFTIAELVFIIIVIGILAAVLIPSSQSNRLREAADQVVSHIRYTQHLAMMDDKFDPGDNDWYKKRWQIFFESDADDNWGYTIYSDNNTNGIAEEVEIARNPQNPSSRLTGGSDINLGKKYGIKDADGIVFTGCGGGDRRIVFDYLGRPMRNNPSTYNAPYDMTNARLITSLCTITIKNNAGQTANITIQQETGFAQVIPF
jgi:Tfp pilus assembly protein PilE